MALIGTVSKSLAPALRLGWVVCPRRLLDAVDGGQAPAATAGRPALEQLALAALIESGRYDRHLRRMRERVRPAARRAGGGAGRARPRGRAHGLAAGFHAVASLPTGRRRAAVVEAAPGAVDRAVCDERVSGPSRSFGPPQLVLGFGNLSEAAIGRGIEAVADLLWADRRAEKRLTK